MRGHFRRYLHATLWWANSVAYLCLRQKNKTKIKIIFLMKKNPIDTFSTLMLIQVFKNFLR